MGAGAVMALLWWRSRKRPGARADVGDILLDEYSAVVRRRRAMRRRSKGLPAAYPPAKVYPSAVEPKLDRYYRHVHRTGDLSALCLSGGGIRSAAFALGVVQALAAKGILEKFDYLSTVSGGGYLGSFLTKWVQRRGYETVLAAFTRRLQSPGVNLSPLQQLRRYSSYLTPRKGFLTADTSTIVMLYVRNLLLNWLIIVPLVLALIALIKILVFFVWALPPDSSTVAVLGTIAIASVGLATLDSLRQRPGWENTRSNPRTFLHNEMLPMLLGGIFASCAILKYDQTIVGEVPIWKLILPLATIGTWIALINWMIAYFISPPAFASRTSTQLTVHSSGMLAAATVLSVSASGLILGALVGIAIYSSNLVDNADIKAFVLLCFGPPILIGAQFVGELVHVGFTSYLPWGDAEREWLARAAGYHARAAMGWTCLTLIVFGGPFVVFRLYDFGVISLSAGAVSSSLTGIIAAILAKSSTTVATVREEYNTWKNWSATVILAIITPIFVAASLSFFSAAIDALLAGQPLSYTSLKGDNQTELWLWLIGIFGIAAVLSTVTSFAINTNRFSLHGVYRNRLIRAFLGASNRDPVNERQRNKFTDFNEKDNIDLASLWPNKTADGGMPPQFLVVNCALNIVAARDLAWQERKALSFTMTPRWVGCADLGRRNKGAYRLTSEYGGGRFGSGISLGTAMTISGAAASPNMGYHSSPALSVLLTIFNVRLGAWLGNPGRWGESTYRRSGPFFAARPLFEEALGLTTDDKRYVYLSDGGHFENLGLYEMVRRRCHLIIVIDAGCDPESSFEDLGNAVRKISIDLNVTINFSNLVIVPRKEPPVRGPYCAVANVIYPEPGASQGLMLYIKPGYQGKEPASVRSYASINPAFPHESTAEQWFGESQFEAYRALGQYIVSTLDGGSTKPYDSVKEFIDAAVAELESQSTTKVGRAATPPSETKGGANV
jgi:hypothetical protein